MRRARRARALHELYNSYPAITIFRFPSLCAAAISNQPSARIRVSGVAMPRKPGVSEPSELAAFVSSAGDRLIIVDVRNPDIIEDSAAIAPLPPHASRPRAISVVWDKEAKTMDLSLIPEDLILAGGGKASVPIITHCGGGGRGQKAKEFCQQAGFGNVLNGGGPEDAECWATFGAL